VKFWTQPSKEPGGMKILVRREGGKLRCRISILQGEGNRDQVHPEPEKAVCLLIICSGAGGLKQGERWGNNRGGFPRLVGGSKKILHGRKR